MDNTRLLIADDRAPHRVLVHTICEHEGWLLDEALDGVSAIKRFRRSGYRLVLLGPALPELDGMNVLIQLRHVSDVPIFLLCDAPDEAHCLEGYRLGADEVIHMPIGGEELAARIKVFLRRTGTQVATQTPPVLYKGLFIDTYSHTVHVDETPLTLTPRQYTLLAFLAQHPHQAFSREALLDEVWGEEFVGTGRTVDTHIKTLRQRMGPYGDYLVTVWGFGYRFEPPA